MRSCDVVFELSGSRSRQFCSVCVVVLLFSLRMELFVDLSSGFVGEFTCECCL